jgi:hypothetical protein
MCKYLLVNALPSHFGLRTSPVISGVGMRRAMMCKECEISPEILRQAPAVFGANHMTKRVIATITFFSIVFIFAELY